MNQDAVDWLENHEDSPYRLELTKLNDKWNRLLAERIVEPPPDLPTLGNMLRPMIQVLPDGEGSSSSAFYVQEACPNCATPDRYPCGDCAELMRRGLLFDNYWRRNV